MKQTLFALTITAALAACDQKTITNPSVGLPCGPQAQQCPGGGCCTLAEDCGGIWPNCPPGYCCANDGDNGRAFGGKRRQVSGFAVRDGGR